MRLLGSKSNVLNKVRATPQQNVFVRISLRIFNVFKGLSNCSDLKSWLIAETPLARAHAKLPDPQRFRLHKSDVGAFLYMEDSL